MTKVLILSNSDISGGAARATYRLHQGLKQMGVASQMLVQVKQGDDTAVFAPKSFLQKSLTRLNVLDHLNSLPLQFYRQRSRKSLFSPQWLPDKIPSRVAKIKPDVINLHWVCRGYLQIESLRQFQQPLVWTLHDMWAFTGGCHYSQECDRYLNSCGACPQLQSHNEGDLSRWIWQRKMKAWHDLNLTIVTPSVWLGQCAKASPIFQNKRIEVIPNGIETDIYKPIDRKIARERLNLPLDRQVVLFGAGMATSDPRKGFQFLQAALQQLSQAGWKDKLYLVIFGSSKSNSSEELGFESRYLGHLSDDISLSLVYAAADVFVAPSTQDNLPNTVMEAIASGTPCVAFNIGGMPDMIEHQKNGYLAQAFQVEDLAQGIAWVLENPERHHHLCLRAREKTEQEFKLEQQASRYLKLYQEL